MWGGGGVVVKGSGWWWKDGCVVVKSCGGVFREGSEWCGVCEGCGDVWL